MCYMTISKICRLRGFHDCLVPVAPYLAGIFNKLRTKQNLPWKVRAIDMLHVLLLLHFILEGLLTEEVAEYNRQNPFSRICDPSPIVIILISWYGGTMAYIIVESLQRTKMTFRIWIRWVIGTYNTYNTHYA